MKNVKAVHILGAIALVLTAGWAIENFYEHPTYGNGLQAFAAVTRAIVGLG